LKRIQISVNNGSLEKGHFSLLKGHAAHEWENRAPAWKANMEVVIQETLEMLS
jgi:hypothetical protein